jgi:DNA polymerase I-like protein with 3'-5' exonuclease and polymerase domains
MNNNYTYINYENATPKAVLSFDKKCKPFNISIPISKRWKKSKHRILVVLQHVDSEDLKSKQLLTGPAGTFLQNVFKLAEDYVKPFQYDSYEIAVINYNCFKTYHVEDNSIRKIADTHSAERVLKYIKACKPHKVLIFGDEAAAAILPKEENITMFRGWPHSREGFKQKFFTTLDFTKAYSKKLDEDGENDEQQDKVMDYANLIGFMSRNVANCIKGDHLYKVTVKVKGKWIDTIPKFKKLLRALNKRKVFAYDTETEGLDRVCNQILTMQFAFDSKCGYVVPLHHFESPFTPKEKAYIERKMKEFWGQYYDPLNKDYSRYYIGQNLKYDNTLTRQQFGVYTIKRRLWDTMAGEFGLDENLTGLKHYKNTSDAGIYSLLQISLNYGCKAYLEGTFKKGEAATIKDRSLKEPGILEYMCNDVQVPFALHEQQIERSKQIKHFNGTYEKDYIRFVLTQMNNISHIHSIMEHRGTACDIDWLNKLKEKDGPLEANRKEVQIKMRGLASVQKANRKLMKSKGRPQNSLFGGRAASHTWELDLNKPDHKIKLFIDVLKLEPISYGKPRKDKKTGEEIRLPSIDKAFQEKYKEVPEIKLFSELSQIEKLTNTYVNGFLKRLKTSADFKKDFKLRPSFGFTTTTGRSNCYDPNLQQIPTRGAYAKNIKRIFAAKLGTLKLKMDYSAHEVRVWSIISGDKQLGSLFDAGRKFRQQYRKCPPIPKEDSELKALFDSRLIYDKSTGKFTWKNCPDMDKNWNSRHAGNRAGTKASDGYYIAVNDKKYKTNRIAFLMSYGYLPPEVDHKDNNYFNDRISNLRPSTRSQNAQNRRKESNKSCSSYKGVHPGPNGRWIAQIKPDSTSKTKHLGVFDSEKEAHKAYVKAAKKYHKEFANDGVDSLSIDEGDYRHPSDILKDNMDTLGDVHIQNVSFFFGITLKTMKKVFDKEKNKWAFPKDIAEKRDAVKSIVFGAIYGRGASSIGKQIGKDKTYVEELLKKFFPRFPKASKWLEDAKKKPLTYNYVSAPTGRRRNLYGHLFGIDNLSAMVERRGCNAPVQGLASDMGHTAAYLFGIYYEKFLLDYECMIDKDIGNIDVMVHDSLSGDFPYTLYLVAIQIMQWCATIGCMEYYNKHYGMKFTSPLEIEMEIGSDEANMSKWDWSEKQLKECVQSGLEKQKERYPNMSVTKTLAKVYAIRDNKRVMKYLDRNFPVLPDVPRHLMAA